MHQMLLYICMLIYALYITIWTLESNRFCPAINIFQYIGPTIHHVSTISVSLSQSSSDVESMKQYGLQIH